MRRKVDMITKDKANLKLHRFLVENMFKYNLTPGQIDEICEGFCKELTANDFNTDVYIKRLNEKENVRELVNEIYNKGYEDGYIHSMKKQESEA